MMFGKNGVLDELRQWKTGGLIRFVGATAHDRSLARRLAADPRVDVLMHRFNMAHRKAARVPRRRERANGGCCVHGDALGDAAQAVCGMARPAAHRR